MLVVYDDVDSEFGNVKFREKGGHGGHNGVRDIISRLGNSRDFPRVKIGIGRPPGQMQVESYVLSRFKKHEMEEKTFAVNVAVDAITAICEYGFDAAASGRR